MTIAVPLFADPFSDSYQDDGKAGLGLRGVAFMTVLAVFFDGFGGSGENLAFFCLFYKYSAKRRP